MGSGAHRPAKRLRSGQGVALPAQQVHKAVAQGLRIAVKAGFAQKIRESVHVQARLGGFPPLQLQPLGVVDTRIGSQVAGRGGNAEAPEGFPDGDRLAPVKVKQSAVGIGQKHTQRHRSLPLRIRGAPASGEATE